MRKPNAKERILETAGRLFHKRGYSEVGINEIIDTAETAKASFYQHYSSKEALCEAWLSTVHEKSEDHRSDIVKSPLTPAKKVENYFNDLETFMVNSDYRGCPYSNTSAVSDSSCFGIVGQIQDHKESIRQFFRDICQQQFEDATRANEIGDRIFLLYSGATTESQNLTSSWPVESARIAALELLTL
tara:strand:+ start:1397 stop:1957 length:561 start_codon:yes stop_codon:yes gene_type:complete